MSTVRDIAKHIAARGGYQGWKVGTKTADNLNIECWAGAYTALVATGHKDADWVGRVVSMVISVRGYRETLKIANQPDTPFPDQSE